MVLASRDRMARTLRGGAKPAFSVEPAARADDLRLEVEGLGAVKFPVTPTGARKLLGLGRPARFGRGESVDHIEYGTYVARVKMAPLATKDPRGRPQLVSPAWPVMIQDGGGAPVTGAVFMVSYANREEKGSDVNVAAHLLLASGFRLAMVRA